MLSYDRYVVSESTDAIQNQLVILMDVLDAVEDADRKDVVRQIKIIESNLKNVMKWLVDLHNYMVERDGDE